MLGFFSIYPAFSSSNTKVTVFIFRIFFVFGFCPAREWGVTRKIPMLSFPISLVKYRNLLVGNWQRRVSIELWWGKLAMIKLTIEGLLEECLFPFLVVPTKSSHVHTYSCVRYHKIVENGSGFILFLHESYVYFFAAVQKAKYPWTNWICCFHVFWCLSANL